MFYGFFKFGPLSVAKTHFTRNSVNLTIFSSKSVNIVHKSTYENVVTTCLMGICSLTKGNTIQGQNNAKMEMTTK